MEKSKNPGIRTGGSLSMQERKDLIEEYLTGQYSKVEIWKKYTGQNEEHGQILKWMRAYGYISNEKSNERPKKILTLRQPAFLAMDTDDKDLNPEELKKRIKELEKELQTAQLKAEGYEIMIEIAEKELKIPIRKKSDTK